MLFHPSRPWLRSTSFRPPGREGGALGGILPGRWSVEPRFKARGAAGVALPYILLLGILLGALFLTPDPTSGQAFRDVAPDQLEHVMPEADRFSEREGDPPVFRAYRQDPETGEESLLGYVFRTSDVPPEVMGYDAPIDVLVGMDLEGTLTGILVVRHRESLQRTRGRFLETPGFQEQYAGMSVRDPFRVGGDVNNISGATITVDAMSRGIRNAARRVATAYLGREEADPAEVDRPLLDVEEVAGLSWMELVEEGPMGRVTVIEDGVARLELYVMYLWDEAVGGDLLGEELFADLREEVGDRGGDEVLLFLGLEGSVIRFRQYMLFALQDGDTLAVDNADVARVDDPSTGKVAGQVRSAGLWVVEEGLDPTRDFQVVFGGELGMGVFSGEIPGRPSPPVVAEADAGALEDPADVEEEAPGDAPEAEVPEETEEEVEEAVEDEEAAVEAEGLAPDQALEVGPPGDEQVDGEAALEDDLGLWWDDPSGAGLLDMEEESALERTLARTSWTRVGALLLLLVLASVAFATKWTGLRWGVLTGTLFYLGFTDGGFLSVSHITSGISVGPGVYLNDLALLLLVVFTVITTLLWGRVFCGFLCPFGALQDFLDRFVPDRFKEELPPGAHRAGLKLKYGILALVLAPAVLAVTTSIGADGRVSLYQYFEPFGTVFFWSPSLLLWVIALTFLLGAVVVPRFYCRYLCPLGAALAIVSWVSPFRIRRVEQCTVCRVCEDACPTGAIRAHRVDFPECVRCTVCEVNLKEKAGTCRHDMERVRSRLAQIRVPSAGAGEGAP